MCLLRLKGIGPRTVGAILKKEAKGDTAETLREELRELGGLAPEKVPDLASFKKAWDVSAEALEKARARGLNCLGYWNPLFPARLREIPKCPVLLFVQGDPRPLSFPSIAVVGTRDPSNFGTIAAFRIGFTLAHRRVVVVSGLAEGCDTAGHQGCLEGLGITFAILAHGHGRIYPKSNSALAEQILSAGGCLISEYPPDAPPIKSRFVERDRLQSGISQAIIVIETAREGGTMHTVRFAEEQHRPIGALQHPPKWEGIERSLGNKYLIETGIAASIANSDDLDKFVTKIVGFEGADKYGDSWGGLKGQLGLFL
jgi:DNA processing protein